MPPTAQRAERFEYVGYQLRPERGELDCNYASAGHTFTERFTFDPDGDWGQPALENAVRILYLLAGVSYYKTTAARTVDLGSVVTSGGERAFLTDYLVQGLAEFAYCNELDLGDVAVEGPDAPSTSPAPYESTPQHPLIPFGGGIDSIVTVEAIRQGRPGAALCIVHPPGDRFDAIEHAAALTGLPVVRVTRELSPLVRTSTALGFFNGHVPITAVITAAAVVAAVLGHRDAVVLSNEHSASVPTLVHQGAPVNHQWSKGVAFERAFADVVAGAIGPGLSVFSYLRCRSELWVAQQFAGLTEFHSVFRSCNRAFGQDPSQRLDHWCGICDKCCFIDLVLAPFMSAKDLRAVFGGHEPLDNPELEERFLTLLGLSQDAKPFECVGDVDECRAAVALASARHDRGSTALLQTLASSVQGAGAARSGEAAELFAPVGPHYIPDGYAPPDLLVRSR
jgi:UDP-N-acetyl-alpha-D-muramoyl-L-alanyl-L-glutamate epimerase